MVNTFLISDTHFSHANILEFKRGDDTPLRDFSCIEEHDEYLIEQWNKTVRPQDKVYHLGDVVINRKALPLCAKLNGHKRLVRGNHDIFRTAEYLQYFEEIYGCRVLDGIIMTHIPIHVDCLARFRVNVHGHLHSNTLGHPKYINVSCEQINYTPISFDDIRKRIDSVSV